MPRVAIEATLKLPMGPVRVTTTHLEYYSPCSARRRRCGCASCTTRPAAARRAPAFRPPRTARSTSRRRRPRPSSRRTSTSRPRIPPTTKSRSRWRAAGPPIATRGQGARPARARADVLRARPPLREAPYCCDFIFVSEDLAPRVREIRVDLDTQYSDHQPSFSTSTPAEKKGVRPLRAQWPCPCPRRRSHRRRRGPCTGACRRARNRARGASACR